MKCIAVCSKKHAHLMGMQQGLSERHQVLLCGSRDIWHLGDSLAFAASLILRKGPFHDCRCTLAVHTRRRSLDHVPVLLHNFCRGGPGLSLHRAVSIQGMHPELICRRSGPISRSSKDRTESILILETLLHAPHCTSQMTGKGYNGVCHNGFLHHHRWKTRLDTLGQGAYNCTLFALAILTTAHLPNSMAMTIIPCHSFLRVHRTHGRTNIIIW